MHVVAISSFHHRLSPCSRLALNASVQGRAALSLSPLFTYHLFNGLILEVTVFFINAQCYCSDKGCGFIVVISPFRWWYDDTS